MQIYDISIQNFRGIKELLNLRCGKLNTYVGKNDSGKSSILKAFSAFFNHEFSSKDVYHGKLDEEVVQIKLRFSLDFEIHPLAMDADNKISIIKKFSYSNSGKLKIDVFYECNDINQELHQNLWGKKEAALNTSLEALALDFSRSGRGVTNLSKIEQIDNATSSLGRSLIIHPAKDFLDTISKQYEEFEFPEFLLFDAEQNLNIESAEFQKQFKPIATDSLNRNSTLTQQIETNVKSDLETEFDEITTLMQKNVPDLERINPDVDCNWKNLVKFNLSLKFHSETFNIPITHKGTGFKRLLMVAYFEYLAQKQNKKNQIFGVEEPETYLHPELQLDLLSSIITLAEDSQFFLTTHSPIYAGSTNDSDIVIVKKENQLSEYFNHQNRDDILDMVIQELGIRPNYNLLNSNYRKVVFVEGSNDCKFWNLAFSKIHGSIPSDILFIPCGGSQVEFFVNADLCQKINRRFIVIVDSDAGASDFAAKQANNLSLKQKVESVGGEFRMLRKREIENYYHLEAIKRLLVNHSNVANINFNNIIINSYNDIKFEIKTHIIEAANVQLKAKNNMAIFTEMTRDEWLQASILENGISTDLEIIIDAILAE
jgi:putative ATP-dependent endonuclease of OLD family